MQKIAILAAALAVPAAALAQRADEVTPAAVRDGSALRSVVYDPDMIVRAYLRTGETFRILLGPGERIVNVLVSDQATIAGREYTEAEMRAMQQGSQGTGGGSREDVCDRNLCRTRSGNALFLTPRDDLEPQSLFIRGELCAADGECETTDYTFRISTVMPGERPGQAPFYGIRFTYPARAAAAAARAAAARRRQAASDAAERRRNTPPAPSVPTAADSWELGRCTSAPHLAPDHAWSDGRTTFLAYEGTRPVPNVYERPVGGGTPTLTQYTVEPERWGNVIRIGKIREVFLLTDGRATTCIINVGRDAEGREMATAPLGGRQ
jgi:type IV secretory pathway VirB9-like protein